MWRLYRNLKMQKQKWASFINATGGGVATGGRVGAGGRQTEWGWCFWRGQVLGRGRVEMEGTCPHRGDHEQGTMCIHSVDGGGEGRQKPLPAGEETCRRLIGSQASGSGGRDLWGLTPGGHACCQWRQWKNVFRFVGVQKLHHLPTVLRRETAQIILSNLELSLLSQHRTKRLQWTLKPLKHR